MQESRHILGITSAILVGAFVLLAILSGFQHEHEKFKVLLIAFVLVLFFQYYLGDIIKFILIALVKACSFKLFTNARLRQTSADTHDRTNFLKIRLASYRSQLGLTQKHRDEQLNLKYKSIANELVLYGKYFTLLLLLVVGSRDPLSYYNTHTLSTVLNEERLNDFGLKRIYSLDDIYTFIEKIPIESFNEALDYNEEKIVEPGWIRFQIAKLMGVVRLRQIRKTTKKIGSRNPIYDKQKYMPGWQLPYLELLYAHKYWRLYEPFKPHKGETQHRMFSVPYHGHLHSYDENSGYVSMLARSQQNSKQVLDYLREKHWLDDRTVALFIEFTLYSVDSNIFSICTLVSEQTSFGSILSDWDVQSCELLMDLDHISFLGLFVLLLYILTWVQFSKYYFLKIWYTPQAILLAWNILDLVIMMLNIMVLVLLFQREASVGRLMQSFQTSKKLEFVDFRIPAKIDNLTSLTMGFLICLTTIRIWKIMHFARVFRIFTRTLFMARTALASTSLIIFIFLFGFGTGSYIINGNNTESFTRLIKSITSSMSFSFGFNSQVRPEDLNHGGFTLGFILYAILMFVVAILLINLFITLICHYFERSKDLSDDVHELNFYDFLRAEYAYIWRFFARCSRSRIKRSKDTTVSETIQEALDEMGSTEALARNEAIDSAGIERTKNFAEILLTQVEILSRELHILHMQLDTDSDSDSDSSESESEENLYLPKNGERRVAHIRMKNFKFKWCLKAIMYY